MPPRTPLRSLRAAAAILLILPGLVSAQVYVRRPVTLSFFPPLSTNGMEGGSVSSNVSLNIIGGYLGRLSGVELGGVFNIEQDDAAGFQAAGVVNVVGGNFTGVQPSGVAGIVVEDVNVLQLAGVAGVAGQQVYGAQVAGVASFAGTMMQGLQVAGVTSVAGAASQGAQIAGVINVCGDTIAGAQVAGVVNVCGGPVNGVQAAGVVNACGGRLTGAQIAGVVNAAEEFEGAQVGLINVAGEGRGLQLGLVNIAGDISVPIGLLSIVEQGRFDIGLWATEASYFNIGIKTGSRYIYNVFALGFQPDTDRPLMMGGLGIGGQVPLDPFFIDVDAIGYTVRATPDWWSDDGLGLLAKLRVSAGWHVSDWLALFAGPTMNVWVSGQEDGSDIPFYDLPLYHYTGDDVNVRIWPGFAAGLQLL